MAEESIILQIDETLKKQAEIVYESMGLSISSALHLFIKQSVAMGAIPFQINADDNARHRVHVLHELAEAKIEALDPENILHDHETLINQWESKRMARQNGIYD